MKTFDFKLNKQVEKVDFFWLAMVIIFFTGLAAVFCMAVVFWLKTNEDISSVRSSSSQQEGVADIDLIERVLEKTKNLSN